MTSTALSSDRRMTATEGHATLPAALPTDRGPMRKTKQLSDLTEGIYDAALEPARWTDVVNGINDFVGGQACGIFSKNKISKFGITHYYCGADPYFIQLYSETHSKFDPLTTLPRYGNVVSIPDLVQFDEYRRGRFYQEWLRPQGCVDAANVVLEKSKSNCPVLLTVLAGKRMVDDEMRRRVTLLVPHLHRALQINKAIELKQSQSMEFADALDGLGAGIFVLDMNCGIIHSNAAGHAMLEEADFLHSVGGRLVPNNMQANVALQEIFANNDDVTIGAKDISMPLTARDGKRYVAHVLPLRSLARNHIAISNKAVAAVFVRRAELDTQSAGELMARTFALTPAEARVLLAIIEVGGVPETAKNLGLAETTVKTHLYRVFAKTGASRQVDLVKIAAGFSNPLAS
jgi:DNA-binding CsgD family transcriptional regulator/PAS domain-containing protein